RVKGKAFNLKPEYRQICSGLSIIIDGKRKNRAEVFILHGLPIPWIKSIYWHQEIILLIFPSRNAGITDKRKYRMIDEDIKQFICELLSEFFKTRKQLKDCSCNKYPVVVKHKMLYNKNI